MKNQYVWIVVGLISLVVSASVSSASIQLQSNFLKNDPTAQAIASGAMSSYDIRNFTATYGGMGPFSTDNFGYRFLSAIRMIGYVKGAQTVGGQNMAEQILNKFERFNNLPVSPLINSTILQLVDSNLATRESLDSSLASKFPLTNHFIDPPLNEPTKEHVAAVFSTVMAELPSNLVVWTEQNFKNSFNCQLSKSLSNTNDPNYKICDLISYPELGNNCTAIVYSGVSLVNKIPSIITDDFDNATTIIHEYAHYLDRNIWPRDSNTSQGLIDTTDFYAISFNPSDRGPGGSTDSASGTAGVTYAYKNPSSVKNDFVSAYAQGWQASDSSQHFTPYEDFAESFTMYVAQGRVFRNLTQNNAILQAKYNWLKQNVFQGQEYQSGDVAGIEAIKAQPTSTSNQATGAFNTRDYSQALTSFVWNYKFLAGSEVISYTPTPTPYVSSTPWPTLAPWPIITPTPSFSPTPTPAAGRIKLMSSAVSFKVYYITEGGYKRWIPTAKIFTSYSDRWEDVVTVPQSQLDTIPDSILIRASGGTKVYKLENGVKRWITSSAVFIRNGFYWDQIAPVNATELNYYPNGASIN